MTSEVSIDHFLGYMTVVWYVTTDLKIHYSTESHKLKSKEDSKMTLMT